MKEGKMIKSIEIAGANNTQIATIVYVPMSDSDEAELTLLLENKRETISIPKANELAVLQDIVKQLIDRGII